MSLYHELWFKVSFVTIQILHIMQQNRKIQEDGMSLCSSELLINNHEFGLSARLSSQLHLWLDRWRQRDELTHWSDRDLRDVGLSWSEVVREAEKPFWRA
jgi:uncharacterized protein YjiS (DUF1127 family)